MRCFFHYLGYFVRKPFLLLADTVPAFCFSKFKKGLDKHAATSSVNICRRACRRKWSEKFLLTLLIYQLGVPGECKEYGWQSGLAGMLFLNNIYSFCCRRLNPGLCGKAFCRLSCLTVLENLRETFLILPRFPSMQAVGWVGQSVSMAELIWISVSILTANSEDIKVGFLQPSSRAIK